MNTVIKLEKTAIDELLIKNSKIISAIARGAKTYFRINDHITLYFVQNTQMISSYSIDVNLDSESIIETFFADFQKFWNALQKIRFNNNLIISIKDKSMIIESDTCSDKVTLSINKIPEDEIQDIQDILDDKKLQASTSGVDQQLTTDSDSFLRASSALMSASSSDSAVYFREGEGIYADRSVVFVNKDLVFTGDNTFVHNNSIKFFQTIKINNSKIQYLKDNNAFYWASSDNTIAVYFVQTDSNIALPSKEELEQITPPDDNYIQIVVSELIAALDFFNGFYEGSIWKPIDFIISNKDTAEIKLNYSHITADIEKFVTTDRISVSDDFKFSVASDSLRSVLSTLKSEDIVSIAFDNKSPGVVLRSGCIWALLANIS